MAARRALIFARKRQLKWHQILYPSVDKNSCVECGLCDRVCPIQQKCESKPKKVESYVLRAKTDDVLMNSTSGGFVTPLAKYVLEHNGIVCAAAYDKDFTVKHILVNPNGGGVQTRQYSRV